MLIRILVLYIFVFHSTFAQASQEYYNGCRSFYNVKWAHSYYKIAKEAQIAVDTPKMVNYRAGYAPPSFQLEMPEYQLQLFRNLNRDIAKSILKRSVDQSIEIYYLIDTQKLPSTGRTINHMTSYLPDYLSKNYCRYYCEDQEKLREYIGTKLEGMKRYSPKRYSFSELATSLSFLVSALNNRLDRNDFKLYEEYLFAYFFLFKGNFGTLMMTKELQDIFGPPLSYEEYKNNSKRHHSPIKSSDVENAYNEFKKMIKNNWSDMGVLVTKDLTKNISDFIDLKKELDDEIKNFSIFTLHAPDIVAGVFRENKVYSDNYCLIYDLVDNTYVTNGSLDSGTSSRWYMAPLLLAMLFIPFIATGGVILAVSWLFYGLTAITIADVATKSYKLYQKKQEMEFANFLTSMSSKEKFQLQELMRIKSQLIKDGKAVGAIIALELIGLGIASKVIKSTQKIYQKLSKSHIINDVVSSANRNDFIGKGIRRYFSFHKGVHSSDIAKYMNDLDEKQIYDLVMTLKTASIGKKVLASEAILEATKLSYVYANSSFYGEINPAKILFDAMTGKYINNEKQIELNMSLDNELDLYQGY